MERSTTPSLLPSMRLAPRVDDDPRALWIVFG
jgi:hypothetical protein